MATNFDEFDRCPACKRRCSQLFPDGKMLMSAGLVLCPKCGNVFIPRSMARAAYAKKEAVIVPPAEKPAGIIRLA